MNCWIVKLGQTVFDENDFKKIKNEIGNPLALRKKQFFEYKSEGVHYVSISTSSELTEKKYHSIKNDSLIAYSGLLAGFDPDLDLRSADVLRTELDELTEITQKADGQFALIMAANNKFECIVEPLGTYKVFYYEAPDNTVYISNQVRLIRLFKEQELNYRFYMNWICSNGNFGYMSNEKNVFLLPEFGRIEWSTLSGLKVDSYDNIEKLINPSDRPEIFLTKSAEEWKNSGKYLVKYHAPVISLSGGFDSRVILYLFWGMGGFNLETFTYPDLTYDSVSAKKIAADMGVSHKFLKPAELPTVEQLDKFISENSRPFLCYSMVADYVVFDEINSVLEKLSKVKLTGTGGDTDLGLRKYKSAIANSIDESIKNLARSFIKSEFLRVEYQQELYNEIQDYYHNKYAGLLTGDDSANKLLPIYYHFERFRAYQSYKLINNNFVSDNHVIYGNVNFLKFVFATDIGNLYRHKKECVHHQYVKAFSGNGAAHIPFSKSVYWDANKFERIKFRLKRKHLDKYREKLFGPRLKFFEKIRRDFYEKNVDHFREVVHSNTSSRLWDFLDRDAILKCVNSDASSIEKKRRIVLRIVPMLKDEMGDL